MKVSEDKSLISYLTLSIPIDVGTTAICFLMPNNKVLKLFYDSYNTQKLFDSYDMLEHITFLSTLSNRIYEGPTEVLLKKEKVIGYIYPYIYMPTINKMPKYTTKNDLLCNYYILLSDIKKMSDVHFRLEDVHHKNLLFANGYKLIDIDKGYQDLKSKTDKLFIENMRKLNQTIIESIFKIKIDEHLVFEDKLLQNFYERVLYNDPYQFYELLGKLFYRDDNLRDVQQRVRIKIHKESNDYYNIM